MSQSDRLTVEDADQIAAGVYKALCKTNIVDMAQQLADTLRENERLRIALEHYKAADDGVYQMLAGFKATKDMECPNSIAGRALRNKDTGEK